MAAGQPHGARRQRRRIAAETGVGEVLPDRVVLGIDFDDATVVGVSEQSIAVGEPARESEAADRPVGAKGRDDAARGGVRDLDGAVVVLVGDEDVAVSEQLGGVGIVELVGTIAGDAVLPILPHDGVVRTSHLDDALVALIGDEDVSARQIGVLHRRVELIGSESGDAELPVLPDDVAAAVHEVHAVVDTAGLFAVHGGAGGDAGARHQSKVAHALGVGAGDRVRRGVARTVSKLPDDVACRIDFDDAIVELIGDEDVARLVEFASGAHDRSSAENQADTDEKRHSEPARAPATLFTRTQTLHGYFSPRDFSIWTMFSSLSCCRANHVTRHLPYSAYVISDSTGITSPFGF